MGDNKNSKFWDFIRRNTRIIIWGSTGLFALTVASITLKNTVTLNAESICELKTEVKDTIIFKAQQREMNHTVEKSLDTIQKDIKLILRKM